MSWVVLVVLRGWSLALLTSSTMKPFYEMAVLNIILNIFINNLVAPRTNPFSACGLTHSHI